MSEGAVVPPGGLRVVAGTWAVAGAVHLWVALDAPRAGAAGAVVSAVLAVAAAAGVVALLVTKRPGALLAAVVTGAVGVAAFLVPRVAALPGFGDVLPTWDNPWPFVAFLLDALVVRVAVFTLRRASRTAAG
ncbi:hypothetical protein BJF78_12055 [Pseudonocardia sp. CNS-139]|nr:hypothetical protein BJF78_12055 [Pseudonocardia sp. CNS-139]